MIFARFDIRRLACATLALSFLTALSVAQATTPSLSGTPKPGVNAGHSYAFAPTVLNAGSRTVHFQMANKPVWLSFNPNTGYMSGIPSLSNAGVYSNILLSATIGTTQAALRAFSITVYKPDQAPKISGAPATAATVGTSYSFQPSASDADGNALTFSVQNKPSWLAFSSTSGRLAGIPSAAGLSSNIVLSVSDGKISTSLPAFAITVAVSLNKAPLLSGTPVMSTFVGTAYSFKPSASDADGNALTFSIQNKPSWASFDASSGLLSGTPSAAGQFANVTISVSDGQTSTTLTPFTLTVSPVVLGSVSLSWMAPTQNVDGTTLTNLAGYRVVYGTSPTALNQTLSLPSPSMTSVAVEDLRSGTYYFAVKAYSASNVESDLSEIIWKTIM